MQIRAVQRKLADRSSYFCGWRMAQERIRFGEQTANQIVGEAFGDFGGGKSAVWMEPADAPVEGSEDGARGESGIAGDEFSGAGASGDQMTDTFFVMVTFYDETPLQAGRQSAGQEMGGGTFDFVEDTA